MDLILERREYREDGIFGVITDKKGNFLFVTLEHAYKQDDGSFKPKLLAGDHPCYLSEHQLHGSDKNFTTYQIAKNPAPIAGILFHIGNFNKDSDGCVLLGKQYGYNMTGGKMICDSTKAFNEFIKLQNNEYTFNLKVLDVI